jgi:hypothetical protein
MNVTPETSISVEGKKAVFILFYSGTERIYFKIYPEFCSTRLILQLPFLSGKEAARKWITPNASRKFPMPNPRHCEGCQKRSLLSIG